MPGPIIGNHTPAWMRPENASVLDPTWLRVARTLAQLGGLADPQSQVLALANPMQVPERGALSSLGTIIKAYHGSPHDFERFSVDKIGTGEGAQAYGHGLYFAEREGTAQAYRDALAPGKGGSPEDIAARLLQAAKGDRAQAVTEAQKRIDLALYLDKRAPVEGLQRAKGVLESGKNLSGKMYEVAIKADPNTLLDWDKPLSQQTPHVRASLATLPEPKLAPLERKLTNDPSGSQVYAGIGRRLWWDQGAGLGKQDVAATDALKQAGIPGIKYLDAGSRTAGEGSRNYVIFDDALVDILKKYGVAGAAIEGLRRKAATQGGSVWADDVHATVTQ